MRLAQYSDDELIEELKHRGIKIKPLWFYKVHDGYNELMCEQIKIGGVVFDLRT